MSAAFVMNNGTGKMHYAEDADVKAAKAEHPLLVCRRNLTGASWEATVYGLHDWCIGCWSQYSIDLRRQRSPHPWGMS